MDDQHPRLRIPGQPDHDFVNVSGGPLALVLSRVDGQSEWTASLSFFEVSIAPGPHMAGGKQLGNFKRNHRLSVQVDVTPAQATRRAIAFIRPHVAEEATTQALDALA